MQPIAAALRAGDVVLVGRRFFIVVLDRASGQLCSVLARRGTLERLRSHVLPEVDDLRLAGLPVSELVVCCDRLRPAPPPRAVRIGAASPRLMSQIAVTLRRVAEAVALEQTPAIRSAIWRCPGGGCGRKIGRQQAT